LIVTPLFSVNGDANVNDSVIFYIPLLKFAKTTRPVVYK